MARPVSQERLTDVARAATRVFIEKGYRRTLMADVAREMGLSAGALYTYVESKEALFHIALARALRIDMGALALPVPTPLPGETLGLVDKWLAERASFPVLSAALSRRKVADARAELAAVVEERYDTVDRGRVAIALVERSALDLPELHERYYRQGRREQVDHLSRYLERRIKRGLFRAVPDVPTAARFIVETVAWFAWHRRGDQDSAMITDEHARATTIDMIVASLIEKG
jgi:AcrR family transcriptional regulator